MDSNTVIGLVVTSVITLGGFIAVIMKFIQPINDLRVVIQKLNDLLDVVKRDNEAQDKKITDHDNQIIALDGRVTKLETSVKIYHEGG